MQTLWAVHLAAAAAMTGVLWVVQCAVYPLFGSVGERHFAAYHQRYTARVSLVVLPLMGVEMLTGLALAWSGWSEAGPGFQVAFGLLVFVWVSTFLVQMPLHRRLAEQYAPELQRRLVATNWVRTVAWTARVVLLFSLPPT